MNRFVCNCQKTAELTLRARAGCGYSATAVVLYSAGIRYKGVQNKRKIRENGPKVGHIGLPRPMTPSELETRLGDMSLGISIGRDLGALKGG